MNLEKSRQGVEIQFLTDPNLQVDLQRIDSHRDRGGVSAGGEEGLSVHKSIRGGNLEISQQGAQG